MDKCRKCLLYSESYDELRALFNDIAKGEIPHICIMFENGIDPDVFKGEKKCTYFVEEVE